MHWQAEVLSSGVAWASGAVFIQLETPETKDNANWQAAHDRALARLHAIAAKTKTDNDRAIVEAQIAMLNDPEWLTRVENLVANTPPRQAITESAEEFALALEQSTDPYLKQRAQDIREVADLWCQAFSDWTQPVIRSGTIVVTATVSVHDILQWADIPIAAIICEQGSPLMHAFLIAQNLGIPVLRLPSALSKLQHLDAKTPIKIDADRGYIEFGEELVLESPTTPQTPPADVFLKTLHVGNVTLEVMANISSVQEATRSRAFGADGVGLVRTEFLLESAGHLLSQDEQVDVYRKILHEVSGPVTFRTFDIGSDKSLSFLPLLAKESNPALGQRGARVYFQYPDLLRTQLMALALAASKNRHLSIMFPMINNVEEWQYCWNMAREVLRELNLPDPWFQWGLMLEVPSAAFLIPELSQAQAQFGSIGTNDLYQYFVARDREKAPNVSSVFSGNDPPSLDGLHQGHSQAVSTEAYAFAKFLHDTAAQAHRKKILLSVCGQLASEPKWALFFIALKIYRLSMSMSSIPKIKEYLSDRIQDDTLVNIEQQVSTALSSYQQFVQWMNEV